MVAAERTTHSLLLLVAALRQSFWFFWQLSVVDPRNVPDCLLRGENQRAVQTPHRSHTSSLARQPTRVCFLRSTHFLLLPTVRSSCQLARSPTSTPVGRPTVGTRKGCFSTRQQEGPTWFNIDVADYLSREKVSSC